MSDLSDGLASPGAAWQRGRDLAERGDYPAASLWLERAIRLAPGDPRIALELANLRLTVGGAVQFALAADGFASLAARFDIVPAWLGLLTARRLLQDHAAAAAALASLLARHCIPDDPAFAQVAAIVAQDAGFDGWTGVRPDGTIHREAGGAIGPPFDMAAIQRVEGVVSIADTTLIGWATRPAAPAAPPALEVIDAAGTRLAITCGGVLPPDESAPFATRHSFAVPASRLRPLTPPFRVVSPTGADLFGSPADPRAAAAIRPIPAVYCGEPHKTLPKRARLAVVMPVYRDLAGTSAALNALLAAAPRGTKIIVVDDASPEPALPAWAEALPPAKIQLIRHHANRGFPAAVNTGIAAAQDRDILLLNSDTLIPPGAIEALTAAAYSAPDIGTATPLSNEATILSVPEPGGRNPMPDLAGATALQTLAAQASGAATIDIPTAIGFCMFIRHDCLATTGAFRAEIFAQGYGEENDFCLRARHAGYRHVAALGAYVAHRGGVSFRAAGRALNARNAAILARLHPGYDAMIAQYIATDPLAPARRRLDAARFTAGRSQNGAVLLISHDHGGGVARIVARDMQTIRDSGKRPILLFPSTPPDPKNTPFPWPAELTDGTPGDYPNLQFSLPADGESLLAVLRAENISHIVLHHSLGLPPAIRGLAAALKIPLELVLHDYSSFCPRITLLTAELKSDPLRYCGEPNLDGCTACTARLGDETFEGLSPAELIARSAAEFAAARRVTAPSEDAARRIARHFPGIRPTVTPWEDDTAPVTLTKPRAESRRRIAIIGGIGPAKGYDILLDCARDAIRRGLALDFLVAGPSADDTKLLETGNIFVAGPYREGEATALIASLDADLAFLPSIWPETWCFALSEAWRAGLYALAFDLGAQAARIAATGRGAVIPLGLPVPRINDALLSWQPRR
jgi:GT2 family glycosyltransferase/glycosyltransferase involved in cell wall biosynthesis